MDGAGAQGACDVTPTATVTRFRWTTFRTAIGLIALNQRPHHSIFMRSIGGRSQRVEKSAQRKCIHGNNVIIQLCGARACECEGRRPAEGFAASARRRRRASAAEGIRRAASPFDLCLVCVARPLALIIINKLPRNGVELSRIPIVIRIKRNG